MISSGFQIFPGCGVITMATKNSDGAVQRVTFYEPVGFLEY
jgi:hypothetical protein